MNIIEEVRYEMTLKDDVTSSVIDRCYYEIHAAALKGMSGFIFCYPRKFSNSLLGANEILFLIENLIDNGFTVTDEEGTDEEAALGIYWAVD